MKHLIPTLFKPIQPSVDYRSKAAVTYREVPPDQHLQPYIHCYWQLKTDSPLGASFTYRVVSDGCIDILIEQNHVRQLFITGFSTKYLEYDLGHDFDYIGIRFLPLGFPALYQIAASTITNQFLPLSAVSNNLQRNLIGVFKETLTLEEAQKSIDEALRAIHQKTEIDPRILDPVNQMLEAKGHIKMKDLDLSISERQLRRLFNYYYGESPKTFNMILRFQNILNAKPSSTSLKENKIFYDQGYYDQAHFIKEFKTFYGVTPSAAFGR